MSSSIRNGNWTKQETETKLENIITDTEKKYHIYYGEYMIYTEDKDKEGIVYLILYDENKEFIFGICYE